MKLNVIHLQKLEEVKLNERPCDDNPRTEVITSYKLKDKDGRSIYDEQKKIDALGHKLLYFQETCKKKYYGRNGFFEAFVMAYNFHRGVVISPDDFMVFIGLNFSSYVNDNAEKLRSLVVNHDQGKKKLVVTTPLGETETEWASFFDLMKGEIKSNTKNGIVDILECNFSTTSMIENVISVATIMDSLKEYFEYGRMIPCCGITDLCFTGELNDWEAVKQKVSQLKLFTVKDEWKAYITGIEGILDQFMDAYKGNPDLTFWNKIMNIDHGRLGSGSTTYYSGWILKLFWKTFNKTKCESDEITIPSIKVPIEIDNKMTGIVKSVELCGGFNGVAESNGMFKPRMELWIWDTDGKTN